MQLPAPRPLTGAAFPVRLRYNTFRDLLHGNKLAVKRTFTVRDVATALAGLPVAWAERQLGEDVLYPFMLYTGTRTMNDYIDPGVAYRVLFYLHVLQPTTGELHDQTRLLWWMKGLTP